MINVFTYGSLMFDRVWSSVVDGSYRKTEALLNGYVRKAVKGEVYPAICPSASHSEVQGIVYYNVTPADLGRLDVFEGELYCRKTVKVVAVDTGRIFAETYVLKEEHYPISSHLEWSAEKFEKKDIHRFIESYFESYRKALGEF